MFAVTISSLSNGSLTMIWHLDPINLLKLSLSDKFLVTLVIVLTSDTSFIIVLLYFVLFFFLLYTYLLSPAHPSCLLTFPRRVSICEAEREEGIGEHSVCKEDD